MPDAPDATGFLVNEKWDELVHQTSPPTHRRCGGARRLLSGIGALAPP